MTAREQSLDYVVFLLSTDWFCCWLGRLGIWDESGPVLAEIKAAARGATKRIFGANSNYFYLDLSAERREGTFNQFLGLARSVLRGADAEKLNWLVGQMLGCGDLSSDDRWALMTFIQREVGSGFEADPSGVLDAGLRFSLVAQVERLTMLDSCRAIESEWDESLREKFDDLPDALGDHAAVGFISAVLWECLRSEASASARSQEVRANIADWLCRGVEMLGMRINANAVRSDLLSAGATEHWIR
ncbi:hypothetical protein ABIA68_000100 [Stenotrophomonas rhizophila]|nr:hypothetical protein BAY15_2920 [Stenotrophomonas rhizophila]